MGDSLSLVLGCWEFLALLCAAGSVSAPGTHACPTTSLALRESLALPRQPPCFAQPVTSLLTTNQGLEQQIEQTAGPGALTSSELCTLRDWQGFSPGYPCPTPTRTFADSLLGEGRVQATQVSDIFIS